jgi:subtilisin family serine protease
MKKTLGILAIVALLVVATVSLVSASQSTPLTPKTPPLTADKVFEQEKVSAWFVEFESAPAVEGTSTMTLAAEKAAFVAEANSIGLVFTERYTFSTLWNGMSVSLADKDLNKLYTLRNVKAIYPVLEVTLPESVQTGELDMYTAKAMTGADIAQSELGITGKGVKIAIMDTGVDYDHPDLGGCFGPFCKVFKGYDFVGDDYDAETNPVTVPDNDPDDCQGHGTHVAGIAAANGEIVGVAPQARIGAYRVFGCDGSTDSDIMLAAMEMILADGMDVLNMSIGSAFTWPQYPTAVGADNLVDSGVVVVASIGNSGDYGLYAAGSPGLGEKVIGVASFDNTFATLPYALVDDTIINGVDAPVPVAFVPMTYSGPIPTSGTEPLVFVGRACNVTMGDTLLADPTGKIALIERGACSFNEKATFAIAGGATGVVIHNSVSGLFNGTLGTVIDGTTPVVGISLEDGTYIRTLIEPTWTWTDLLDQFPSPTAGLISSFSSYGLSPDLAVKPDIGAPGGNIYSTYPVELGSYASMGGTSMASPHVAGASALLLQAHPLLPAGAVRGILQNSADPQVWNLNPATGLNDHVYRQGAGLLDIDDAILATTAITPAKLAFGEGSAGPKTQTLTVSNMSALPVEYDLWWGFDPAVSASGIIDIEGFWYSCEEVTFSRDRILVPPFGSTTVDVTLTPPDTDEVTGCVPWNTLYNGWIQLRERTVITGEEPSSLLNTQQVYRVPYAGFAGDYQDIVHLNNPYGLPWITDSTFTEITPGQVFTLTGDDFPWLVYHLDHQSPLVKVDVLSGLSGRRAYPFFFNVWQWDYHPRNSTVDSFWAEPWDATRLLWNRMVAMPDGTYQLRMSVLKALGDPDVKEDWEYWTSPPFVIDRP